MGDRITQISERQLRLFRKWQKKWVDIGFSTEPANRPRAEAGYEGLYRAAGISWPGKVVWVSSPFVVRLAGPVARFLIELAKSGGLSGAAHQEVLRLTKQVVASEVEGVINKKVLPDLERVVLDAIERAVQQVTGSERLAELSDDLAAARVALEANRVPELIAKTLKSFRREGLASQVDDEVLTLLLRNVHGDPARLLDSPIHDGDYRGRFSFMAAPIWHERGGAYLERAIASAGLLGGRESPAQLNHVDEAFRSLMAQYHPVFQGQFGILDAIFSRFLALVCGVELSRTDQAALDSLTAVADSGSVWYPCAHFVMASERPTTLDLTVCPDDSGSGRGPMLSNESAPVASWADGWGVYVVRDVHVPFHKRHVVESPEMITRREVEEETDDALRVVMAQQSVYGAPFSYRKRINQALSATGRRSPARVFLQANRALDGRGGILCWFDIPLNETFVDRVRYLKELRRKEDLWSVEDACTLPWSHLMGDMYCAFSSMSVSEWTLTFKAMLDRRFYDPRQRRPGSLHSSHPPQVMLNLEATWTFDSIDEYLAEEQGEPCDYLLMAEDQGNDEQFREFYRQVSVHLAVQHLRPLRLTEQDHERATTSGFKHVQ